MIVPETLPRGKFMMPDPTAFSPKSPVSRKPNVALPPESQVTLVEKVAIIALTIFSGTLAVGACLVLGATTVITIGTSIAVASWTLLITSLATMYFKDQIERTRLGFMLLPQPTHYDEPCLATPLANPPLGDNGVSPNVSAQPVTLVPASRRSGASTTVSPSVDRSLDTAHIVRPGAPLDLSGVNSTIASASAATNTSILNISDDSIFL